MKVKLEIEVDTESEQDVKTIEDLIEVLKKLIEKI